MSLDLFRNRFWYRVKTAMVFVLAGSFLFTMFRTMSPAQNRLKEGTPLPKSPLVWVQGGEGPLNLTDFRGKGLLVNFWGTWCGPCRNELPVLQKLQKRYGGEYFTILGVNEEPPSRVRKFLASVGIDLPMARDATGALSRKLSVKNIPFSVFVGPEGKVYGDVTGELDYEDGAERIEQLIARAKDYRKRETAAR